MKTIVKKYLQRNVCVYEKYLQNCSVQIPASTQFCYDLQVVLPILSIMFAFMSDTLPISNIKVHFIDVSRQF